MVSSKSWLIVLSPISIFLHRIWICFFFTILFIFLLLRITIITASLSFWIGSLMYSLFADSYSIREIVEENRFSYREARIFLSSMDSCILRLPSYTFLLMKNNLLSMKTYLPSHSLRSRQVKNIYLKYYELVLPLSKSTSSSCLNIFRNYLFGMRILAPIGLFFSIRSLPIMLLTDSKKWRVFHSSK